MWWDLFLYEMMGIFVIYTLWQKVPQTRKKLSPIFRTCDRLIPCNFIERTLQHIIHERHVLAMTLYAKFLYNLHKRNRSTLKMFCRVVAADPSITWSNGHHKHRSRLVFNELIFIFTFINAWSNLAFIKHVGDICFSLYNIYKLTYNMSALLAYTTTNQCKYKCLQWTWKKAIHGNYSH